MTSVDLRRMTVNQLVERFTEIALAQDEALLMDEIAKFNRLFDQMEAVKAELKGRDGDQRRMLLRLYNHRNIQVRLKAAKATLAVAPEAARRVIQQIADSREYPQAGDAGMTLVNLDRGIFRPT
jgi:predicted restriction endonuclease